MKNFKDFIVELLKKISDGILLPETKNEKSHESGLKKY